MVAAKKQETHRRSAVIVTLRQALKRSGSGDAALRESIRVAASVVLRDLAVNRDVEEVAFEAPWLTEGVARLAGLSDELRISAVEIQTQAGLIALPALRELCSTFLDQCRDHEALRHALIQAAYSSDEPGLGERAEAGP